MELFGIGLPELLVIFVVALLVLGPERMMTVARDAGKLVGQLRKEVKSIDIQKIIDEPEKKPVQNAALTTSEAAKPSQGADTPAAIPEPSQTGPVSWSPAQPAVPMPQPPAASTKPGNEEPRP